MKKQIQNIIIHTVPSIDSMLLTEKINEFYVNVLEQRLEQSNLTMKQKITIVDEIIKSIK